MFTHSAVHRLPVGSGLAILQVTFWYLSFDPRLCTNLLGVFLRVELQVAEKKILKEQRMFVWDSYGRSRPARDQNKL